MLEGIIKRGMENVNAVIAQGGDPLTRLWRLIARHIHYLGHNLVATAVFLHERKRVPLAERSRVLKNDYGYQSVFIDTIRDGIEKGQIRPSVDPKLAALSVLGSANWVYTWYNPDHDLEPDYIGAQFATMTVSSLASAEALRNWKSPEEAGPSFRAASKIGVRA